MARVTPFTASSQKKRRDQRKRNGWSAKWSDELKVREGQRVFIQLTPGDYPRMDQSRADYYEAAMYKVQHTKEKRNGETFQAWDYFRPNEGECSLSTAADAGHPQVSSPRDGEPNRYFMNVIQFGVFQRVPVFDANGQELRYRQGKLKGQPVFRWESVDNVRDRKKLLNGGANEEDICFFRKKFMELPPTHFTVLQEIGRRAKTMCGCGGRLFPEVYICGECDQVLLDVNDPDCDFTESEVLRYGDKEVRCSLQGKGCGTYQYPTPVAECENCDTPTPLRFNEIVAEVTKQAGDKGFANLTLVRLESLADFQFANGDYAVIRDEDGEPLVDPDAESGSGYVLDEGLESLGKAQFDFEMYTTPKPNSYYSKILNLREGQPGFHTDSAPYGNFRE